MQSEAEVIDDPVQALSALLETVRINAGEPGVQHVLDQLRT